MNIDSYQHDHNFPENVMFQARALTENYCESNQGIVIDIRQLQPLVNGLTHIRDSQSHQHIKLASTSLIHYLKYIQGCQRLRDTKVLIGLSPDCINLVCMPLKPHTPRTMRFLPTTRQQNIQDCNGTRYLVSDRCINFEKFCALQNSAQNFHHQVCLGKENQRLAQQSIGTGQCIAGHGALEKDYRCFRLPKNVTLNTYVIQGQKLSDLIGIHIESGRYDTVEPHTFKKVFKTGNLVPDYLIFPPDDRINTLPESITVPHVMYLSEILTQISNKACQEGKVVSIDLATCQSYMLPDLTQSPRKNLLARIALLESDVQALKNEYGDSPPDAYRIHFYQSFGQILADATQAKLYRCSIPKKRFFAKPQCLTRQIEQLRAVLNSMDKIDCY